MLGEQEAARQFQTLQQGPQAVASEAEDSKSRPRRAQRRCIAAGGGVRSTLKATVSRTRAIVQGVARSRTRNPITAQPPSGVGRRGRAGQPGAARPTRGSISSFYWNASVEPHSPVSTVPAAAASCHRKLSRSLRSGKSATARNSTHEPSLEVPRSYTTLGWQGETQASGAATSPSLSIQHLRRSETRDPPDSSVKTNRRGFASSIYSCSSFVYSKTLRRHGCPCRSPSLQFTLPRRHEAVQHKRARSGER